MKGVWLLLAVIGLAAPPASGAHPPSTASAEIDRLIGEAWAREGVNPNPPATDEVWLRRVFLDVAGRIPAPPEAREFLDDRSPDRRARLIDRLLASEGYVNHSYNFWADLLRINTEAVPNRLSQEAWARWIRRALAENRPYDRLVRELLTGTGMIWENPAAGYYLRDPGMPLDNLSNTVQVFLGTRIVCAQCHNHPFDKWTQMEYYKLAAYTYGIDTGNQTGFARKAREYVREQAREKIRAEIETALARESQSRVLEAAAAADKAPPPADTAKRRRQLENEFRRERQKEQRDQEKRLQRGFQLIANNVRGTEARTAERLPKLPPDYQYSNGKPGQSIHPAALFAPHVSPVDGESPHETFGRWLTAPENPRFTLVIANRLWKRVMGRGLIEPVDELTDETKPSHPELMEFLEKTMKDVGYDTKAYLRTLLNTDLYARQASTFDVGPGERHPFPGPVLRRMTAEQTWDSFLTLIIPEVDRPNERRDTKFSSDLARARSLVLSLESLEPAKLVSLGEELHGLQEKDRAESESLRTTLREARQAMDRKAADEIGRKINRIRRDVGRAALGLIEQRTGAALDPPMSESRMTKRDNESDAAARSADPAEGEDRDLAPGDREKRRRERQALRDWSKRTADLFRAANLPSPAPRGHFLREFGQSDRETIENATDEATVPQALNLMNGRMFALLTDRQSVLAQAVSAASTPEEKIAAAWRALLSRPPTAEEAGILKEVIQTRGAEEGLRDIVHAIINTQQFLYIQ